MTRHLARSIAAAVAWSALAAGGTRAADDGVFARFRLLEPTGATYYVRLRGYIHRPNWYLPRAVFPAGADKDLTRRVLGGAFTGWFDVKAYAGKGLHGRMNRSGGIAELPSLSVTFVTDKKSPGRKVVIELATAPDAQHVVKRFDETFDGETTTFLISPTLAADAKSLESLSQMEARHLTWARAATGGHRVGPKKLMLQTSFYGFTMNGAEVLHLLGFNVLDGPVAMYEKFPAFRKPGHTHQVLFGPAATREQIDALMARHARRNRDLQPGALFGFADEICCRPPIGKDPNALAHFRAYLARRKVAPAALGVEKLTDTVPIETPAELAERCKTNAPAARRTFYHTCRFRQLAGTERIRWHTEAVRKHFPPGMRTTTLVADHPYFGGTGLGMGLVSGNFTWGGYPLALDWFDLARRKAVDLAGIEDWMGLQYMYGPNTTWEGFQLMGFQAAIFRSAGRGTLDVMAWITPSDERNLRLKSASALAQGAKHFFYWTYGPTCFGTENYWSDLRGEYDGIAHVARHLAAAEPVLAPGRTRKTRVAVLYSVSSDLWQPFGYVHMLERRATYLALVHGQYLVDFLTEQDIEAGRLADYRVLYATDACITTAAAAGITRWVRDGGVLYGACAAGSRNEFDEPAPGLAKAFGIAPAVQTAVQKGEYRIRGRLNTMKYTDRVRLAKSHAFAAGGEFGVLGVKAAIQPAGGRVVGTFADGSPAAVTNRLGRGRTVYLAACPGLSYLKDARFVPAELAEKYPPLHRRIFHAPARAAGAPRLVELSHAVVEAGVYDAPAGTALVLANFTYRPIESLAVRLPVPGPVAAVRSAEHGPVAFTLLDAPKALKNEGYPLLAAFTTKLGQSDVLVLSAPPPPGP